MFIHSNDFSRNERDTDNSGLRNRVPAIPDDDEEETTLASQIRPKYQLADINEDEDEDEDEDISEDEEEQVIDEEYPELTQSQPPENIVIKSSKDEVILIFIIVCICVCYTVGVYLAITESQKNQLEFRLLPNEEFSAKMMTRDLRIPFYVKKKYQPQSKEELLQLWTNVENEWRSRKKT